MHQRREEGRNSICKIMEQHHYKQVRPGVWLEKACGVEVQLEMR